MYICSKTGTGNSNNTLSIVRLITNLNDIWLLSCFSFDFHYKIFQGNIYNLKSDLTFIAIFGINQNIQRLCLLVVWLPIINLWNKGCSYYLEYQHDQHDESMRVISLLIIQFTPLLSLWLYPHNSNNRNIYSWNNHTINWKPASSNYIE